MSDPTLLSELERACREGADQPALIWEGGRMTYRELWSSALRFASGLRETGVRKGDRVICALGNRPEHLVAAGAAWACGAVHVGIDPRLTGREVGAVVEHLKATAVLGGQTAADIPASWADAIAAGPARLLTVADLSEARAEAVPAPVAPEDVALIRLSSGTTGAPKAVVGEHGTSAAGWAAMASRAHIGPDDAHLGHLPLAFGFGFQVAVMALLSGGRIVLMERFDATRARALIARHGISVLAGAPAHFRRLLDEPDGAADGLGSLRLGIGSSDAFPASLLARLLDELALEFLLMYGSAEGFGVSTSDPAHLRAGSVGTPYPGDVVIMDAGHHPVPAGGSGEIVFQRQPQSRVYVEDAPSAGPGWYHTGDVGHLDHRGWLYVTGRIKDQINRGGLKIDPVEVRDALLGCTGIADAEVIGVPHPVLGERVCACVVPADATPAPDLDGIRAELRQALAAYKLPDQLRVLDAIPRTDRGKVDRAALAELAGPPIAPAPEAAANGASQPPAGPRRLTLPNLEMELVRLLYELREIRSGLEELERHVLDQVAHAARAYARRSGPHGDWARQQRSIKPGLLASTPGLRARWELMPSMLGWAGDGPAASEATGRGPSQALIGRLAPILEPRDELSRLAWMLFLGCAARTLVPHHHLPEEETLDAALVTLALLNQLQPGEPVYVGRPPFVTDELLSDLRAEAAAMRSQTYFEEHALMAPLGPSGREFAHMRPLRTLLADRGVDVEAINTGKFVYLDEAAMGPGVHLHSEPFAVNVELNLDHMTPGEPMAQVALCPPYEAERPIHTRPGEMVVWFNGSMPHARQASGAGERMETVSIFMEPIPRRDS